VVAPAAENQSSKFENHIENSNFIERMHTKVEESHLKTEKMVHTLESFSSDKHHIE
jgi:hypothetical protein